MGTPAEEGGGGKIVLARRGAFTDAAAAMLTHPSSYEVVMPHINAVATLDVTMTGRAAHASMFPERGINALDGLVLGYNALAALRQHMPPTDKIHGIFTDGGQLPNVVPARAAGRFMVRSASTDGLAVLQRRVVRCFRGAADATGAHATVSWRWPSYSEMWHSHPIADAFEQNVRSLGRLPLSAADVPATRAGSTDMGDVSHLVPAIHPKLAISPPDVVPHSAEFARWSASPAADCAVLDGAKAMAMTVLDLWLMPELARAANRELEHRAAHTPLTDLSPIARRTPGPLALTPRRGRPPGAAAALGH
ncbi:peptidase dimerization domain-containing protein [Rhodococcus koreensis]